MEILLRNIHKSYGAIRANDGVSLRIPPGTIQGILGENGAGKSTLMKILSGFISADRGEILLDGRPASIRSPAEALRAGIGMLHQDPLDFPSMTVLENFIAGSGRGLLLSRASAAATLRELGGRLGFSFDPSCAVESLTVGERQQLEVLRLLRRGARVLILDEPTTGISAAQKEALFAALRRLAARGMTVIFVSHKLGDIERLCGRAAVLRRGRLAGEAAPPYDTCALVRMMFGREAPACARGGMPAGETVLAIRDLSIEGERLAVRGVSLDIKEREIIGLAGIEGSGQALFLRACAGLARPAGGRVSLGGDDLTGESYRTFVRKGVAYVPSARLEEGLIPGLTLAEHFMLTAGRRRLFIDRREGRRTAEERISEFGISGSPDSPVETLSGGNQQRVLLALCGGPRAVVLLEHPTRGLDIESAGALWGKLRERCRRGEAVVFISSDIEEILYYSDRILVFCGGRVSAPLAASETAMEQLGRLIGGKAE